MWYITHDSITISTAKLGISNLRRSRVSQAQDSVSFSVAGPFDAAPLFEVGDIVGISYKDDSNSQIIQWFQGRVIQIPRAGSGTEESMEYVLAGPWWFLDNLVYQQLWAAAPRLAPADLAQDEEKLGTISTTDPISGQVIVYDKIGVYKSRVILGQKQDGKRMTSAEVITDVINFANAAGAPIQLGNIEPNLKIPYDEQQDVTCAEVIRRMLRWSPDAITWFNYSSEPPTFNCQRRSSLASLTIPVTQTSAIQIIPRDDLVVPAVILKYEQTSSVNGAQYEDVSTDRYPESATGREFGALAATLQLAGSQANYVTQKIVSTEIPQLPAGEAIWWPEHDASCKKQGRQETTIIPGSTSHIGTPLEYELKEGQIQDWMDEYSAEEVTYTAQVRTVTKDEAGNKLKEEIRTVSCTIITTNAESRTYVKLASLKTGEAIPSGLAQALYNSLNPLQYEGTITLTEQECADNAPLLRNSAGYALNISGAFAAWASMNALIQQIEEDVDTGTTTIRVGPAEQLSPQDLVERLRANRGRGVAYDFLKRQTGETSSDDNTLALSGRTPIINTAGAAGAVEFLIVANTQKKITLDPAAINAVGATELKIITINAIVNGEIKNVNIIASDECSFFPAPPGGDCVLVSQSGKLSWITLSPFKCSK